MYDSLAHYYDLIHESLTADRAYILHLAAQTAGPLLELGCGTGRLLFPLARAGHHVTGVDNSRAMLDLARGRLEREEPGVQKRIELVEADMVSLTLNNRDHHFSLALLPYNTLLHLHENQIQQLLRHLSPYLQRRGYLFIDVANPFIIDQISDDSEPALENVYTDPQTGATVRQFSRSRLDVTEQCLHTSWTFVIDASSASGSESKTVEFDYHYYYPHQLQLMLQNGNFRVDRMLGGYDGSPFKEDSERLILLAQSLAGRQI